MRPDYVLLGLLARRPASGYDIGKWLRSEGVWLGRKPAMSPTYRSLADLTERGWITATTDHRGTGPDAKVYSLTAAGEEALLDWARQPFEPAPRPMDPAFAIRLNFAGQLGIDIALDIVRTELAYRRRQRADEQGPFVGSDTADPIASIDRDWLAFVEWTSHARGWESTSLYIAWLELTERKLTLMQANESAPPRLVSPQPSSDERAIS